ncbi:hypothetical protein [Streptomyces sp. NPDC058279]|uniref:hypothetical protein n=1 Tax=Streptomyces sp. NPDC058279 TaxID=3346418 RepID=UPI0036EFE016
MAGLARLEGYLISQAARREADEAGENFAEALSWLGPDEQRVIAERFAQHHLRLKWQMLTAVVGGAQEPKAEYGSATRSFAAPGRPHRTACGFLTGTAPGATATPQWPAPPACRGRIQ